MKPLQIFVLIILILACFIGPTSGQILGVLLVPEPISIAVNIFMAFCLVALAKHLGVEM